MCLCMCCHGWRVFHTVCIFFLALAIASLVGLVGEADYPPICLHSPLAHQDLALRFYFTRCEVRHLGYFISLDYHMCTFRTTSLGVCSVLAGPFFFNVLKFLEGSPKWSGKLEGTFCVTWSWESVLIFLVVSVLYPGCLIHLDAIGW